MSKLYVLTKTIERHTSDYKVKMENTLNTVDEGFREKYQRVVRDLDGIGVRKDLYEFCTAVRKKMPGVKFGVSANPPCSWDEGIVAVNEVWMFAPGEDYCRARLSYKDHSPTSRSADTYGVLARGIKNEKYADHREQHRMVTSENMARAVKAAQTYATPVGAFETARRSEDMFITEYMRTRRDVDSMRRAAWNALVFNSQGDIGNAFTYLHERFNLGLAATSVTPSPTLLSRVADYYESRKAAEQLEGKRPGGWFVRLRERLGEQVMDAIVIDEFKDESNIHRMKNEGKPEVVCEVSTAPRELVEKIAVLSMLENGAFVEDVGMKVTSNTFWVLA